VPEKEYAPVLRVCIFILVTLTAHTRLCARILPPSTTRVHVGNIPLQLTDEQLGALFTDKGFRVVSASVAMDRRGKKNRGFGFVEFATEEETESAKASLNCTLVGTRKITVSATQ
jgi:RNA recognition motif-containing protein